MQREVGCLWLHTRITHIVSDKDVGKGMLMTHVNYVKKISMLPLIEVFASNLNPKMHKHHLKTFGSSQRNFRITTQFFRES